MDKPLKIWIMWELLARDTHHDMIHIMILFNDTDTLSILIILEGTS